MTQQHHPTPGSVTTPRPGLRHLRAGIHPAIPLVAFPVVLLLDTALSLKLSMDVDAWVLRVGLIMGSLTALAIPFLLWVYFVVSIYLILTVFDQMVDLKKLGEIVAMAFMFALVGKLFEGILKLAGLTAIAFWPYVALAMAGFGVTIYGVHATLKVPKADAVISVVVSLVALETIFFIWTHGP